MDHRALWGAASHQGMPSSPHIHIPWLAGLGRLTPPVAWLDLNAPLLPRPRPHKMLAASVPHPTRPRNAPLLYLMGYPRLCHIVHAYRLCALRHSVHTSIVHVGCSCGGKMS